MVRRVPWAGLPAELAGVLRPALPAAVDDTILAISREVPAYRGAWDGPIGPTVRRAVELALGRMLGLLGTDEEALDDAASRFYANIGAGENAQGRSLGALLAAYRTGARVSWEHMARAATRADVPTEQLVALAESIFVYIDQLSAASAAGHAHAQVLHSGYQGVVRSQLAEALIEGVAAVDPARVAWLADTAGWPLPERLAVAVIPTSTPQGPPLPTAPPDVLVLQRGNDALAILPNPSAPGRRERLSAAAPSEVYVGTVRPPSEAPISLAHAIRVRGLVQRGLVPAARVVAATDHLPQLVVTADDLCGDLAERALRPLAELSPARRAVLIQTLAAWLDLMGDRAAVAQRLFVHPQTVSYRMGRLHELFGETLATPQGRFTLQLALAVQPA